MRNKLESLRDELNKMLESNEYTYGQILAVSEDLDKLIVKYYNDDELCV